MNERILSPQLLKLVQEAGPGYSLADPEWVKKFAELIVQECGQYLNSPEFIGRSDLDWAIVLNEHFGVEE